jgi:nitronate monooxygenase
MQKAIRRIRALTQHPFAVNLFVPCNGKSTPEQIRFSRLLLEPHARELGVNIPDVRTTVDDQFREKIDILLEEKVPVASFTFGLPDPETVNKLKAGGIKWIGTATTVREALAVEQAGADAVVVQGSEAGGHRGTFMEGNRVPMVGTLSLVPQVADRVCIPVVAAGGIADGRGILAVLALGAEAAQMGTAFLTCKESTAHPLHKAAILNGTDEGTVLTRTLTGKWVRAIDNALIQDLEKHEEKLPPYPVQHMLTHPVRSAAAKQNRPDRMGMWAGQSGALCREQSASKLIESWIRQMEEAINRFSGNRDKPF